MTATSLPDNNSLNIVDEHAQLRDLLQAMQACFTGRQATSDEVAALLDIARQQLVSHFEHEEQGGFFQGVVEAAPHLRDVVIELAHEHAQFLALIDRMRARAASHDVEDVWRSDCARLFEEFRLNLLAHESGENELMQEAYSQDIGSKD